LLPENGSGRTAGPEVAPRQPARAGLFLVRYFFFFGFLVSFFGLLSLATEILPYH
jgi:hypothetical protein